MQEITLWLAAQGIDLETAIRVGVGASGFLSSWPVAWVAKRVGSGVKRAAVWATTKAPQPVPPPPPPMTDLGVTLLSHLTTGEWSFCERNKTQGIYRAPVWIDPNKLTVKINDKDQSDLLEDQDWAKLEPAIEATVDAIDERLRLRAISEALMELQTCPQRPYDVAKDNK